MALGSLHAARDQSEPPVFGAQDFDQQAALAPRARVQDEGGFGGEPHQSGWVGQSW